VRVEVGGKLRGLSQVYVSCGCKVDSVYGKLGKVLLYRQQICDSRGAGMEGRDIRNGLLCSALLCSALLCCYAVLCCAGWRKQEKCKLSMSADCT